MAADQLTRCPCCQLIIITHHLLLPTHHRQLARHPPSRRCRTRESKSGYCRSDVVGETMITSWLAWAFARRLGLGFGRGGETLSRFEHEEAQRLRRAQSLRRLRG